MSFTKAQISFLQRLLEGHPLSRPANPTASYFAEHYSLGRLIGRRVEYTDSHFEAAEQLLRAHQVPVQALGAGMSRAQAATYGGMSEKAFSVAPHADSVALKALGGCVFEERPLLTPGASYMVLTVEQARQVRCERIMVVENFETFRRLQDYAWVDRQGLAVLVVYRGDKDLPLKDAAALVASRSEPLWGFFDFDPAGLVMANALPFERFERLLLPDTRWLEAAADTPRGRQLYDRQAGGYENVLNAAHHPQIIAAWRLMKLLRSAVTQERMQGALETG